MKLAPPSSTPTDTCSCATTCSSPGFSLSGIRGWASDSASDSAKYGAWPSVEPLALNDCPHLHCSGSAAQQRHPRAAL
jgi:hypothetical protein